MLLSVAASSCKPRTKDSEFKTGSVSGPEKIDCSDKLQRPNTLFYDVPMADDGKPLDLLNQLQNKLKIDPLQTVMTFITEILAKPDVLIFYEGSWQSLHFLTHKIMAKLDDELIVKAFSLLKGVRDKRHFAEKKLQEALENSDLTKLSAVATGFINTPYGLQALQLVIRNAIDKGSFLKVRHYMTYLETLKQPLADLDLMLLFDLALVNSTLGDSEQTAKMFSLIHLKEQKSFMVGNRTISLKDLEQRLVEHAKAVKDKLSQTTTCRGLRFNYDDEELEDPFFLVFNDKHQTFVDIIAAKYLLRLANEQLSYTQLESQHSTTVASGGFYHDKLDYRVMVGKSSLTASCPFKGGEPLPGFVSLKLRRINQPLYSYIVRVTNSDPERRDVGTDLVVSQYDQEQKQFVDVAHHPVELNTADNMLVCSEQGHIVAADNRKIYLLKFSDQTIKPMEPQLVDSVYGEKTGLIHDTTLFFNLNPKIQGAAYYTINLEKPTNPLKHTIQHKVANIADIDNQLWLRYYTGREEAIYGWQQILTQPKREGDASHTDDQYPPLTLAKDSTVSIDKNDKVVFKTKQQPIWEFTPDGELYQSTAPVVQSDSETVFIATQSEGALNLYWLRPVWGYNMPEF